MRFKRVICMLMITMLVSSCKSIHELVVTNKPTTDEIVLTEVVPGENNTPETIVGVVELPSEIGGHKVTYTDDNKTEASTEQPATIEANKINWLLIALIGVPPLLILLYVINKKVTRKLNENVN